MIFHLAYSIVERQNLDACISRLKFLIITDIQKNRYVNIIDRKQLGINETKKEKMMAKFFESIIVMNHSR